MNMYIDICLKVLIVIAVSILPVTLIYNITLSQNETTIRDVFYRKCYLSTIFYTIFESALFATYILFLPYISLIFQAF